MPTGKFIEDFSDFILERVPTSRDWAESIAVATFSTAVCQNRFAFSSMGELPLNVWYLHIAPSGIGHKTVPMKNYGVKLMEKVGIKVGKNLLVPPRFSLEGMLDYFHTVQNFGLMVKDEFTSAMKDSAKDYLTNIMEFYSEIWDCYVSGRYTRKVTYDRGIQVFVNCLAATTPYIYRVMRPEFFVQGTGNRILIILYDLNAQDSLSEEEIYGIGSNVLAATEGRLDNFADELVKARNSPLKYFYLIDESLNLFAEFARKNKGMVKYLYGKNENDLTATYMQRMPAHILKLAAIKTMADRYLDMPYAKMDDTQISSDAMNWAMDKGQRHLQYFNEMMESWRSKPQPIDFPTLDEQIAYAFDTISAYSIGITWPELRSKVNWKTNVWSEILKILFDTQRIVGTVMPTGPQGGRPVIRIHSKQKMIPMSANVRTIDDWESLRLRLRL